MQSDGHSAMSLADRLGISHANLVYRWKEYFDTNSNETDSELEQRVCQLAMELRRTQTERDILKKP